MTTRLVAAAVAAFVLLGLASTTQAQSFQPLNTTRQAPTFKLVLPAPSVQPPPPAWAQTGRLSVPPARPPQSPAVPASKNRSRSAIKSILWSAAGGVGGFFGGGFLGAAIEGDSCQCDDPGLKGFLIGAPIGAIAGSILGWTLSR